MFIVKLFYPLSFILSILPFNIFSNNIEESLSFLNAYKMAIDETSIVSKTDLNGVITYVNKQFCEIYIKNSFLVVFLYLKKLNYN